MNELKVIRALKPLFKRYGWPFSAVVVLGILGVVAEGVGITLFIPFLSSGIPGGYGELESDSWLSDIMYNVFEAYSLSDRLWTIALCILGLIVLKNMLTYSTAVLFNWLEVHLSHVLRLQVFDQLLYVDLQILDAQASGKFMNLLESQTSDTSDAVWTLATLVTNLCTLLVFSALLVVIDWQLALLATAVLILISLLLGWLTRRVETLSRVGVRAEEALSQRIFEVIGGMRTIRMFGRGAHERRRFAGASRHMGFTWLKISALADVIEPAFEILAAAILVLILYTSFQESRNFPTLLVFIFILYRMYPQFAELSENRNELIAKSASVDQVIRFLDVNDKRYIHSGSILFSGVQEAIWFKFVSFRYNGSDSSTSVPSGNCCSQRPNAAAPRC